MELLLRGTAYGIDGLGVHSGSGVTVYCCSDYWGKVILERIVSLDRAEDYQYAGDLKAELLSPDFDRVLDGFTLSFRICF